MNDVASEEHRLGISSNEQTPMVRLNHDKTFQGQYKLMSCRHIMHCVVFGGLTYDHSVETEYIVLFC